MNNFVVEIMAPEWLPYSRLGNRLVEQQEGKERRTQNVLKKFVSDKSRSFAA
jgi:hypothetical protein